MQFIHRSVGEPAEGSLTRYPTLTNVNCFKSLFTGIDGASALESVERASLGRWTRTTHIPNRKV